MPTMKYIGSTYSSLLCSDARAQDGRKVMQLLTPKWCAPVRCGSEQVKREEFSNAKMNLDERGRPGVREMCNFLPDPSFAREKITLYEYKALNVQLG
jgi:hypothetical protein